MAIENRDLFTYGIIIACIGIALMFFPAYKYAPTVVFILRYFGVVLAINAGVMVLMSGIWDSETLFKVGFGLGLGSVGLLIGANIGNVIDIGLTLARNPMNMLFLALLLKDYPVTLFLFLFISNPEVIRDINAAMVRAIVTFVLTGVVLVLELIALKKSKT